MFKKIITILLTFSIIFSTSLAENNFSIKNVEVLSKNKIKINFSEEVKQKDYLEDSFKITDDNEKEIIIKKAEIDGKSILLDFLDELKTNSKYKILVLDLQDKNGNTIKSGYDANIIFTTPKDFSNLGEKKQEENNVNNSNKENNSKNNEKKEDDKEGKNEDNSKNTGKIKDNKEVKNTGKKKDDIQKKSGEEKNDYNQINSGTIEKENKQDNILENNKEQQKNNIKKMQTKSSSEILTDEQLEAIRAETLKNNDNKNSLGVETKKEKNSFQEQKQNIQETNVKNKIENIKDSNKENQNVVVVSDLPTAGTTENILIIFSLILSLGFFIRKKYL